MSSDGSARTAIRSRKPRSTSGPGERRGAQWPARGRRALEQGPFTEVLPPERIVSDRPSRDRPRGGVHLPRHRHLQLADFSFGPGSRRMEVVQTYVVLARHEAEHDGRQRRALRPAHTLDKLEAEVWRHQGPRGRPHAWSTAPSTLERTYAATPAQVFRALTGRCRQGPLVRGPGAAADRADDGLSARRPRARQGPLGLGGVATTFEADLSRHPSRAADRLHLRPVPRRAEDLGLPGNDRDRARRPGGTTLTVTSRARSSTATTMPAPASGGLGTCSTNSAGRSGTEAP